MNKSYSLYGFSWPNFCDTDFDYDKQGVSHQDPKLHLPWGGHCIEELK
jgi:hypothetical protein